MQVGSLDLQIFLALILFLTILFVAFLVDLLKGNNEKLREHNIELRVRQDERERLGLFQPMAHPITWLQELAAALRSPTVMETVRGPLPAAATAAAPTVETPVVAEPAAARTAAAPADADLGNLTSAAAAAAAAEADRNPARRHRYDEFKESAKPQSWATKEELEQLAARASRIRARHEAAQRKQEDSLAAALAESARHKPKPAAQHLDETPKLEVAKPAAIVVPMPAPEPSEVSEPALAAVPPPVEVPVVSEPVMAFEPTLAVPEPQPEIEVAAVEVSALAEAPAVTPEIAEVGEVAAAPAPEVEEEPYINIWLEAPPAPAPAPVAVAAIAAEPAIPSLAELREEEHEPALRSRIHTVHVPAADEARTDDIAISPAAEAPAPAAETAQPVTALVPRPVFGAPSAPVLPQVSARPVETVEPSYDVAALGKATIDNRAGLPSGIVDSGEAKLEIPPGLHESSVLSQLIENQTPFSGVVVAIGLNDYESVRERLSGGDSAAALNKMVLSMLRPQDFACRFLEDEYILVYPGERGSSAQRRLFQVSEKLWDFQLRSLGNLSVMFSWGGLEVTNETLSESVASARERMYQTKRNRKPSSAADSVLGRRKVVNG